MTLTHARHLEWAASSGEPWTGASGLTAFGREVVRAMESLGVIVDVSHVHGSTLRDVARIARKPFIASHSCAAALCPASRNLTDDQIKAVAASGGMVGVNFFPGFLDPDYFAGDASALEKLSVDLERIEVEYADDPVRRMAEFHRSGRATRESRGPARADLDLLVAHIRHVVDLVGDDHVGLGSDFDGLFELPPDVPDCLGLPAHPGAPRPYGPGRSIGAEDRLGELPAGARGERRLIPPPRAGRRPQAPARAGRTRAAGGRRARLSPAPPTHPERRARSRPRERGYFLSLRLSCRSASSQNSTSRPGWWPEPA